MNNDTEKMMNELTEEFCRRAQLYGCDAVHVLISTHNDKDGTLNKSYGCGNWYARQGMAQEFITEEISRVSEHVKVNEYGDDDE